MANEIAANFQHKYDNMWTHLLQQKANRLRDFVTVKQSSGKLEHFDQYGLLEFDQKTARSVKWAFGSSFDFLIASLFSFA